MLGERLGLDQHGRRGRLRPTPAHDFRYERRGMEP